MGHPAVDLVIVHRDKPVAVLATVDRFLAQSLVPRIVVVDNGSAPARRPRRRPDARVALVEAGANTGFGPGANIGFRWLLARAGAVAGRVPTRRQPAAGLPRASGRGRRRPALCRAGVGRRRRRSHADPRPLLRRHPGARHRRRRLGALRLPARHAHAGPAAKVPRGGRPVRRALLRLLRGGRAALRAKRAGWQVGVVAEVRNTDVGSRAAVVDYLQLRNTLLMVREHSGRYHAHPPRDRTRRPGRRGPGPGGAALLGAARPAAGHRPPAPPLRAAARRFVPPAAGGRARGLGLGRRHVGPDPHQVDAGHHQPEQHRQRPEQDGGQPHHPAPPGERPGPLGPPRRRGAPTVSARVSLLASTTIMAPAGRTVDGGRLPSAGSHPAQAVGDVLEPRQRRLQRQAQLGHAP